MIQASHRPPSVAELQSYIRAQTVLLVKTVDGSSYRGSLLWFDDLVFAMLLSDDSRFTINRANIIGYGPDSNQD